MSTESSLLDRIDRLESLEQIKQLPPKYALCVDMRDFDSLVNLFVEDVGVPGKLRGRAALKTWYDGVMRKPGLLGSAHGVLGHIVDFESTEIATGLVYSRNDLELPNVWMIEMMAYLDRYERRVGRWYFQRRTPLYWYQCDINNPPIGPNKLRFEGMEWKEGAFHDAFPTWKEYWEHVDTYGSAPVKPPAPLYRFLETIRGTSESPKVNPGGQRSS